jgi:hypothetical protein
MEEKGVEGAKVGEEVVEAGLEGEEHDGDVVKVGQEAKEGEEEEEEEEANQWRESLGGKGKGCRAGAWEGLSSGPRERRERKVGGKSVDRKESSPAA